MSNFEREVIEGQRSTQEIIDNPMSYQPYRSIYHGLKNRLIRGYPIPNDVDVAVIGNNTLLESSFRLRGRDRASLEGVDNPGKSGHIAHTRSVVIACLTMTGSQAKREDHLYIVPAPLLRDVSFTAIYVPTAQHPLHVRLIPHELDDEGDIPLDYRIKLISLLQANKVDQSEFKLSVSGKQQKKPK